VHRFTISRSLPWIALAIGCALCIFYVASARHYTKRSIDQLVSQTIGEGNIEIKGAIWHVEYADDSFTPQLSIGENHLRNHLDHRNYETSIALLEKPFNPKIGREFAEYVNERCIHLVLRSEGPPTLPTNNSMVIVRGRWEKSSKISSHLIIKEIVLVK
jgi:hypothetical protein